MNDVIVKMFKNDRLFIFVRMIVVRIVFLNEHNGTRHIGGDVVQMMKTKEYLERKYDVEIKLCDSLDDEQTITQADIVHVFNIQTIDYTVRALDISHCLGKAVVLSTIFWDLRDALYVSLADNFNVFPSVLMDRMREVGITLTAAAYNVRGRANNVMFDARKRAKYVLEKADYLLPNSNEELTSIISYYDLKDSEVRSRSRVVPNAVDFCKEGFKTDTEEIVLLDSFSRPYILQVASISPIKNQIGVVKALMDNPSLPILFIGKASNDKYEKKLKILARERGNVTFIEHVPNSILPIYYKHAACHVLPSFRESPGLASLEAIVSGIPTVVSDKRFCPVEYYQFEKYATVCNPYDSSSIRCAIDSAMLTYDTVLPEELKRYEQRYSYETVADETYAAYCQVLGLD